MAKTADIRPKITLACTQCKERNYITKKNRRNDPDRLELKKFCPRCKGELRNVPRNKMRSPGYTRSDGTVAQHTHTYQCVACSTRFEINQAR